jgi:hypothetical protein
MAVMDCIQDLKEDPLGQRIVSNKVALVGDAGEQVPLRTEFNDHVGAVDRVHDAN